MKKIKLVVILTLIALSATVNATAARPGTVPTQNRDNHYTHAASGVQFDAPPAWKAEPDGDMLTLTSADGTLSVIFWVPEEGTVKESFQALNEEFGKVIKNMRRNGEPTQGTLNGMTIYNVDGTGVVDGVAIQWSAGLLEAKKPVIVLSIAGHGAYETHQRELAAFVKSIKRVN
jgi:hypothetical protein